MAVSALRAAAELHVHLRGAMPAALFARLLEKHPPREALAAAPARHLDLFRSQEHLRGFLEDGFDPASAVRLFDFQDFHGFLISYLLSSYFVRDEEDFRDLVDAVAGELACQGLRYAEVTVSVPEYRMHGIALEALTDVLSEASRRTDIRLRWIVDVVRNFGHEAGLDLLQQLLRRPPDGWVGITIGGSEADFPPAAFREVFRLARANGLRLSAHAGEAAGPESVWDAIRVLEVDRVGHGVRAIEDPWLGEFLAEKQIPLEVCPTSNLKTGVFRSLAEHSLPRLVNAGVAVTINTDDPSFFDCTLAGEFEAARAMGLDQTALEAAARNAERFAFDGP